jgi:hypothetical protein
MRPYAETSSGEGRIAISPLRKLNGSGPRGQAGGHYAGNAPPNIHLLWSNEAQPHPPVQDPGQSLKARVILLPVGGRASEA